MIARSIWTHASKVMIAKMLSEIVENSSPDGRFLTSVILARWDREDYKGNEWVGRVEKTDAMGVIKHSTDWIRSECHKNGLRVNRVGSLYKQTWLLITRAE